MQEEVESFAEEYYTSDQTENMSETIFSLEQVTNELIELESLKAKAQVLQTESSTKETLI